MQDNRSNGNTNILNTFVDAGIGTLILAGKVGWSFTKWCFDGWIDFNKPNFDILFEEIRLYNSNKKNKPILIKTNHTDKTDVYMFTVPTGLSVEDFASKEKQFAQFLNTDLEHMKIENINNLACITVYKKGEVEYNYEDYKFPITSEICIPIGINLDTYSIKYWKPNDVNSCHLLVAGNTGAGKSTLIYVILSFIVQYRSDIDLYIQDVKMVDMWAFKDAKQVVRYNQGKDYAEETIKGLVDEMKERYKYLVEKNVRSVNELKPKDRLNSIIYIVEELAAFQNKKNKDDVFFENLALLLAQGRAVNITVICITQSPYSDILPGELKANFPCIIGLKTRTQEASKVISGDLLLLHRLRGKGHGYYLGPNKDTEIQVFNIKLETINKIVEGNKKPHKEENAGESIPADYKILD